MGYPQSPPELRQELIAEQFVRGQSDPELKKYLWVVIRTQKDKKLQTLIEVCTDFSSLSTPTHLHRPAEQTFTVHLQVETPLPYAEECDDSEDVFAMGDRPPWINRRAPEPTAAPTLQQMFALARRMGYEMRPIAGQPDAQRQPPKNRPFSDQNRGFRSQARTGRYYSKIKCFSCGQFGHMQTRCPRPDGMVVTSRETLHRDRDLTHTGLYALHLTPTSSSFTTPSSPSSPPDTSIHQQSTSCTETCASSADRDHTETQDVSSHDVMDGTLVSRTALQSMSLDQIQP